ncbi:TonB-dependent receptor [Sphingobium subterraneum]|uniref:Iron complex outermembrane receptor protein n=1 Tax=Sphingobium subterraneum TaxID=627688 RepID=A0A841IXD0_9SPHN|nr:TonB-dependent receptor [Sphingobium subterraneum]MBB6123287.1 iron complex outermembrane receptor protein [Sphingobium subterraneum]
MTGKLYASVSLLPCLLLSATAFAQDANTAGAAASPAPTTEQAAAYEDEIIITAQRREGTVQDTPLAIAVLSGSQMASAQINDPTKLTNVTTGVQLSTVGQQLALFVRGAGAPVANVRADPAAAYSIDGIAIARPVSVNGAYYDLARVEVVKGPQGTLYGRNSTVGAINIITNRPSFNLEGSVEVEAGNYDLFRGEAMVNVPLSDTFALRGAVQATKRDGYLSNGYNDADNYSGRLRALYQPSSDISLLLTASYYRDHGKGSGDVSLNSPTGSTFTNDAWFVKEGPPNFFDRVPTNGHQNLKSLILSAEFQANLNFATLTVIPAYLDTSYRALTYTGGFEQRIDNSDKQKSVEVRLASPGKQTISWIIGGLYLDDTQDGYTDLGSRPGVLQREQTNDLGLKSFAAFGQVTVNLTDQFRITGGARYSNETKDLDGFVRNLDLNQNPLPGQPVLPSIAHRNFEDISYRVGLEYDVSPDSLLYASVATGYKAGGFNVGLPPVNPGDLPNSFDPESMTAYTIGSKNVFANNRVRLNLEAWYWDYRDVQQVQFGFVNPRPAFALVTYNAAKQESYGAEIDGSVRIGDGGTFSGNLTYTHSTWKDFALPGFVFGPFNIPASNLSGADTPFAPRWAANLSYTHALKTSNGGVITPGIRTRIRSAQTLNTTGVIGSRVDGTMSTDIWVTYQSPDSGIEVQLYANNLEDEPVFSFSGVTPAGHWGRPGNPLTFGIRAKTTF